MKKFGILKVAGAVILSLIIFGAEIPIEAQENSITVAIPEPMETLDSPNIAGESDKAVAHHVLQQLVILDPEGAEEGKLLPELATSWEIAEDNKTWTFHLRKGVKFTDGTPWNAEAVKVNLERGMRGEVAKTEYYEVIDSLEVIDEHTINIITKLPYPDFIYDLAHSHCTFVSPKDLKGDPLNPVDYIGTGPYKIKEFVPRERVVLVKNEDYWGEQPKIDKITFVSCPDPVVRVALLESGEVDAIISVPPEMVPVIETYPNLTMDTVETFRPFLAMLNFTNQHLKDERVRYALNYAINKEEIAKFLLRGMAAPVHSIGAPSVTGLINVGYYEYNPEKAKQLLSEAGWKPGTDGILVKDGERFILRISTPIGRYLKDADTADAIAGYLEDVGIDARVTKMEWATYWSYVTAKNESIQEQDLILASLAPSGSLRDPFKRFFPLTRLNLNLYENDRVTEFLNKADSEMNTEKRLEMYTEVQRILWNDAWEIFLHYFTTKNARKVELKGVVYVPTGHFYFQNAWLAKEE